MTFWLSVLQVFKIYIYNIYVYYIYIWLLIFLVACQIFSFGSELLVVACGNLVCCHIQETIRHKYLLLFFFSKNFIVFILSFSSMMYFELIFAYGIRKGPNSFFVSRYTIVNRLLKRLFCPLSCLDTPPKINILICFWSLNFLHQSVACAYAGTALS